MLWLSGPVEEGGDILGHLAGSGGGAILVVDHPIKQLLGHSNGGTWEVRVVVKTWADLNSCRGFAVAGEQGEDVVWASVAGLDDQAEIRGEGSVVGSASSIVVCVGWQEVVGELISRKGKTTTNMFR